MVMPWALVAVPHDYIVLPTSSVGMCSAARELSSSGTCMCMCVCVCVFPITFVTSQDFGLYAYINIAGVYHSSEREREREKERERETVPLHARGLFVPSWSRSRSRDIYFSNAP